MCLVFVLPDISTNFSNRIFAHPQNIRGLHAAPSFGVFMFLGGNFLGCPSDRKPRGVISLPGCIAEAVNVDEDYTSVEGVIKKEPRKARVPKGFFGLK